jgi:hypothetical protein
MAPGFNLAASRANTGSAASTACYAPPNKLEEIQLIEYRYNRFLQRLAQPSKALVDIGRQCLSFAMGSDSTSSSKR